MFERALPNFTIVVERERWSMINGLPLDMTLEPFSESKTPAGALGVRWRRTWTDITGPNSQVATTIIRFDPE